MEYVGGDKGEYQNNIPPVIPRPKKKMSKENILQSKIQQIAGMWET